LVNATRRWRIVQRRRCGTPALRSGCRHRVEKGTRVVRERQPGVGPRKTRVECQRTLQQRMRLFGVRRGEAIAVQHGAVVALPGAEVFRRLQPCALGLGALDLGFDRRGDCRRHLVLHREQVAQRAIEVFAPQHLVARCIGQNDRHANAPLQPLCRAVHEISHAQQLRGTWQIGRLRKGKLRRRCAGGDEQAARAPQRMRQIGRQAFGEHRPGCVPAEIGEPQHRDRWLVGRIQRRSRLQAAPAGHQCMVR
jgi:hypothetical protein